jgi:hypothetical protein
MNCGRGNCTEPAIGCFNVLFIEDSKMWRLYYCAGHEYLGELYLTQFCKQNPGHTMDWAAWEKGSVTKSARKK